MSKPQRTPAAAKAAPTFTPVPVRPRHDGWTPEKQMDFIAALAATGCVTQACKGVGMSSRTAYDLYNRQDAGSFRAAWDMAVRHCYAQLSTAMLSRAIHGTANPIFFKGEQIGERRTFDNRLGMWMLGKIAPDRFGAWRDGFIYRQDDPDAATKGFHAAMRNLASDLAADCVGKPRAKRPPQPLLRFEDDAEADAADEREREAREERDHDIAGAVFEKRLELIGRGEMDPNDRDGYARWQAAEWQRRSELFDTHGSADDPDPDGDAS